MLSRVLLCVALLWAPFGASAKPQVDALRQCLADNTSGRDRKELARWVFLAMAAHPEMKGLSSATPAAAEESSKAVGGVMMRLLAESCASQARAAMAAGGNLAVQVAFESLGRLAMQELMADRNVAQSMAGIERHVDAKRLNEALGLR